LNYLKIRKCLIMSKREPVQDLIQDPIPLKRWKNDIPTSSELVEARNKLQHKLLHALGEAIYYWAARDDLYAFFEDYMKNLYVPMEITYDDKSVTEEFYKKLGETVQRLEKEWTKL